MPEVGRLDGFRFIHRQPIVLRDIDGFGHVNNAVYLTYIENARVAYLAEVFGARTIAEIRNIMASVTVNFRAPAAYGEIVEVGVRIDRIGTKSFTLGHEIWNVGDRLLADATSVQVMYDYERSATVDFPEDWLQLAERFEGVKRQPNGTLRASE
jgi:acyl-CoA thioester hydrolase